MSELEPEGLPGRKAEGSVEIAASPDMVWRALTDATELARWFPLEARVEPGEGGSVYMSWKNEYAGESKILVWDPPHHLRTTWGFDPHGVAQVTDYLLEARSGNTFLRVVTSGFPEGASWDAWIEGTRRGWVFELASLKHYLERHRGEDRQVAYVRRRVPLTHQQIWDRLLDAASGLPLRRGRTVDDEPLVQYAAVVDDPADSLMRVSVEPCLPTIDARDVTLWLSAWGPTRGAVSALEQQWSQALVGLFPEGRAP